MSSFTAHFPAEPLPSSQWLNGDPSKGIFCLMAAKFLLDIPTNGSEFWEKRCDLGNWGPVPLGWSDDNRVGLVEDLDLTKLRKYIIVVDGAPDYYIIYIEVDDPDFEEAALASTPKRVARTLTELLDIVETWTSEYQKGERHSPAVVATAVKGSLGLSSSRKVDKGKKTGPVEDLDLIHPIIAAYNRKHLYGS